MATKPALETKSCFVIAPIGEEASETRRRSDQVLKHIIRPAAEECGYTAGRADEIDKPGLITSQVIQRVVGDPLVIADLTETNPNVFYELAIRHAIRKPLVQIIEKGERIPFDVAGTRTIYVDHQDLDSAMAARQEIVAQIHHLEASPGEVETPISVSLDLQFLRQSENPEDRNFAEVLSNLAEIRGQLSKIAETQNTEATSRLGEIANRLERFVDGAVEEGFYGMRRSTRQLLKYLPEISMGELGGDTRGVQIAMVASLFRESAPWLYEAGMEAYRQAVFGSNQKANQAIEHFTRIADMTTHHPLFREFIGREKSAYYALDLLRQLSDRRLQK